MAVNQIDLKVINDCRRPTLHSSRRRLQ